MKKRYIKITLIGGFEKKQFIFEPNQIGYICGYIEGFYKYNEKYNRNIRFEVRKWECFKTEKVRLYEIAESGNNRGWHEISIRNIGELANFMNAKGNITIKLDLVEMEN